MADRVGVITGGGLILVEEKHALIKKWGRKSLTLNLAEPLEAVPGELADWKLELAGDGHELVYEFDSQAEATGVPSLLRRMSDIGVGFKDLHTRQSSLEDIFVGLVHESNGAKGRSEEHTSELQSLMRNSYAVFCLKKTN